MIMTVEVLVKRRFDEKIHKDHMQRTLLRHCRKRTDGTSDAKWQNQLGKCNIKFRTRL